MIDTVKLKYNIEIPEDILLKRWEFKATMKAGALVFGKYVANIILNPKAPKRQRVMVKGTYLAEDYTLKPLITIELSVPKVVFGNNYKMVFDLEEAADKIDRVLSDSGCFPPLPPCREATLGRLDACYNYQVGSNLYHYLQAIAKLEYPHRKAADFKYQGVQFKSNHKTGKFYNKGIESGHPESKGLLRQEVTIMKTKNIALHFEKKDPTFGNLSLDLLKSILDKDLEALKLKDVGILSTNQTLERLVSAFGDSKRGMEVFGIYKAREERGKNYLDANLGVSKQKVNRRMRQISDIGIAIATTNGPEFLPPLIIDIDDLK